MSIDVGKVGARRRTEMPIGQQLGWADPYILCTIWSKTSIGLCTPREPLSNPRPNLVRVSDWKCEFDWQLSCTHYCWIDRNIAFYIQSNTSDTWRPDRRHCLALGSLVINNCHVVCALDMLTNDVYDTRMCVWWTKKWSRLHVCYA